MQTKRLFLYERKKEHIIIRRRERRTIMDGKKKREREKALAEHIADMERLKLGPTKLWTGLVTHHKDVFVSHVIPKLNGTDRLFFSKVNRESWGVLEYAGVNVSKLRWAACECTSISTLEWAWNQIRWGEKSTSRSVMDQAWFCW